MKNTIKIISLLSIVLLMIYCNKKAENNQETILKGITNILVDETLTPIIEDQVQVFESIYDAKITLEPKSEIEVLKDLIDGKSNIAIMSQKLTEIDSMVFVNKKLFPKQTPFATDAIALICNRKNNDTLIDLQNVIDFMQGKTITNIKGLVFDNPNSSSIRLLNQMAGLKKNPEKGIFSFKTNAEVIKYVSENIGMIGVVGVNWLLQPTENVKKYQENIVVLSVKDLKGEKYIYPSQNNLAEGTYPLARDLYIINCQSFAGLGMGFGSFITGERGQRIILKSGLLPVRIPGRKLKIKN